MSSGLTIERRVRAAYGVARGALAAVWVHQGVVPKLLGHHPMEVQMFGPWFSRSVAVTATWWVGVLEVCLGVVMVVRWRSRWPAWFSLAAMPVAWGVAAAWGTDVVGAPFNVTAMNGMVMALAGVVLLLRPDGLEAGRGRLSGVWGG